MRRVVRGPLHMLHRTGAMRMLHRMRPRRITVLAYHRIADPHDPAFRGLVANVSATPDGFARQLDRLARSFSVISLDQLLNWLRGAGALPEYPALITFDDGYRDAFDNALPALQRRGLPAVLFVATSCIGSSRPFFWDLAAWCFRETRRTQGLLPLVGHRRFADEASRSAALSAWLGAAKRLPQKEIGVAAEALRQALDVAVDDDTFAGQHLSWDEVRALARGGVAIGAHTCSHAILSRLRRSDVRSEVVGSKRLLESELGVPVTAFAYPNGLAEDYGADDAALLEREGFACAFTLAPGPASPAEVRREPWQIRRVLVTGGDDDASLSAKVCGLTRMGEVLRRSFSSRGRPAPRLQSGTR